MNMQSDSDQGSGDSAFYDMTGAKPRPIGRAEALGDDDGAAAVEATEGDTAEETDTAAEPDGSDEDKGVEDTVPGKGLYGGTIEEVSRAIAAEHRLELMQQRLRRELRKDLTEHELAERGQELAELVGQKAGVEADKKAANARYNARIKDLDEQIETLAGAIEAGADNMLVDCCLLADFATNTVQAFRLDTRERIETRAMTGQEREKLAQGALPFDREARAVDAAEPDPNAPPDLEQGQRLAATRPDPAELSATGLVTAGCAENATYIGPHTTDDGQRFAAYKLDGGNRHAFVPWPEPEGETSVEMGEGEGTEVSA